MCGGSDISDKPRGGALAVLSPPTSPICPSRLRCDLLFHAPGSPHSLVATHARLTRSVGCVASLQDLVVVVHQTGDMRRATPECGTFRQVTFAEPDAAGARVEAADSAVVERQLDVPLQLAVGDDGVIGRRVSVFARTGPREVGLEGEVVAEGIVGYNF